MIKEFKGPYHFLSNFWVCPVMYEGVIYPSSEHAYMAAKTEELGIRRMIQNCPTPGEAKRMGRTIKLRDGWEEMKIDVMYTVVTDKFIRNPNLKAELLATAPRELIEGNWWGDKIWGICLKTNQGENYLGQILMQVRRDLQPEEMK